MRLALNTITIENFKHVSSASFDFGALAPGLHFLRGRNLQHPRLGSNECLAGSTLIDCPRDLAQYPTGIPIRDLVGKQFITYSWDFSRDTLTLSKVIRVWCVGRRPVYRVLVSAYPSGRGKVGIRGGGSRCGKFLPPRELIGTANHPVMLCDGSWVSLKDLCRGDCLKSLYRRDSDKGIISWSENVCKQLFGQQPPFARTIYYGLANEVSEYRFICDNVHGPRPDHDVHHKDHNGYNHTPTNLEWKTRAEHSTHHLRERNLAGTMGWKKNGQHPRGMAGKHHTPETRRKITDTLKRRHAARREQVANHRVMSVEFVGYEDVYDMEVAGTHNFVANGIFVHNSGKSTLFADAPCWCLYGRTVEGLRGPDVRPWDGGYHARVAVGVSADNVPHEIERSTEANGLRLDGEVVDQAAVDALLGISLDVFTHTMLLGQGRPLFYDLTPADKLDKFEQVLGLDRWERRAKLAKQRADGHAEDAAGLGARCAGAVATAAALERQVADLRERRRAWEGERAARIAALRAQVAEQEAALATAASRRDEASLAADGAGTELDALDRQIAQLNEQLSAINRTKQSHEQLARFAEQRAADLQADLDNLGGAGNCPTCGQSVTGTDLDRHRRELSTQIKGHGRERGANKRLAEAAGVRAAALSTQALTLSNSRSEFHGKLLSAQADYNYWSPICASAQTQISSLRQRIADEEAGTNPHATQDAQRALDAARAQVRDLEEQRAASEEARARAAYWVAGFRDVRLFVLDEVLGELELATCALLPEVGLDDWSAKYAAERETKSGTVQRALSVMILSPHNDRAVRWESFSGGARQRLRLVGALALSEVLLSRAGVEPAIEVLDEPSQFLSAEGVSDLCDFLADRAASLDRAIIYCDHVSVESDRFASTITVTRGADGEVSIDV